MSPLVLSGGSPVSFDFRSPTNPPRRLLVPVHRTGKSRACQLSSRRSAPPLNQRVSLCLSATGSEEVTLERGPTPDEDDVDLDEPFVVGGKGINSKGAGRSFISPGWLTQLGRLWGGKADVPVVSATPSDVKELLGGALFQALYKWMLEAGPIYLLPTGPTSSFLVISGPEATKHVLKMSDNPKKPVYGKGLVAEVSKFLFGDGFAVAGGEQWRVRRKAVGPAFHRSYLNTMCERVFGPSAYHLVGKLHDAADSKEPINMEGCFSQLTLDVVGKAVFNYDFDSLSGDSPLIQAVYTSLKETEQRATDLLPIWKIPLFRRISGRYRRSRRAVKVIRKTTEDLIKRCKDIVEKEGEKAFDEEFIDESDPSILRFLIASREEVTEKQLRDDLLSMLVAGHETTGSALTWTLYLLVNNPEKMKKAQAEIDSVLGDRKNVDVKDYQSLKYITRCVCESLRLYPHPPVLLRRASVVDELPGGIKVPRKQNVLLSIYNLHRSPDVWENPEEYIPERFPVDGPVPNEANTDYKFVPFSGGPRKCVGDQFAMMEAILTLGIVLREFDFELVPDQEIGLTTGATIHTTNGLYMTVSRRQR
ncbi:hypothetical protein BSKO_03682 [Bryopsis sp. KO-2023]|nr:hypothetical protein BSKO_03682 [Bryopsis sp. KO-2023]